MAQWVPKDKLDRDKIWAVNNPDDMNTFKLKLVQFMKMDWLKICEIQALLLLSQYFFLSSPPA